MEKVSIIMCTYNGEKYLNEQIQSILNQTFTDWHLYVSDDGSSDQTPTILDKWKTQYSEKISVFYNEQNIGYNENFAKTIMYAQGDYIAISDQDDVWLPYKIEKQLNFFLKNSDTILVHHMEEKLIDNKVKKEEFPLIQWAIDYEGNDIRRFVLINVIAGHQMMFKKELLKSLYPFPPGSNYVYDWWIATIATLHGYIGYVKEVLLYHRLHENNTWFSKDRSSKLEEKHSLYHDFVYKRYSFLKEKEMPQKKLFFIEKLYKILVKREMNKNNWPLFLFLLKYRVHIFPVKSKYFFLEQYAYLKRSWVYRKE